MKHIIKPAFSLFIIAAISTALLSFARDLTLEPIQNQRRKTQENTMRVILTEAAEFKELQIPPSGSMVRVFEGRNGGQLVGYVVELSPVGYSGAINIMVGISVSKNEIAGLRVLRHTETPGLGALSVNESFYGKYEGKKLVPLRVVRISPGENDIEAITGATITTRAITNAVNEAIEWYNKEARK